jgi:hypothetical protein
MTDILALDIATRTGFARGRVACRCANCDSTRTIEEIRRGGGLSCCPERKMQLAPPIAGSIRFGQPSASDNAVFAHCLRWLSELLEWEPRPEMIIVESLLSPTAKAGHTSRNVRDRLAGLHGVVRAVSFLRGCYRIDEVSVGDVRGHFIGERSLKRDAAKRAVMRRCQQLGWSVDDDNQADALALWSYAAALIEPDWGLQLSPLFNKNLRAAE